MKPIKRNNISNQVFERLKEEIISRRWLPGDKIPSENELTAMLGVSRIPIREALQRLAILGLLETRQGEGTFVKELSPGIYMNSLIPLFALDPPGTIEVLEYRRIIEVGSMELTVQKATSEDIEKLEEILTNMRKHKDDIERFAEEDLNFHLALAEITRNSVLIKINHVIKDVLKHSMTNIVHSLGTRDGLHYHKEILKAIKAKDILYALELMREHVERTIVRISQDDELEKNSL